MGRLKFSFQTTVRACFAGYAVQAVVNNFVPLLFLTFERSYGVPLSKITLLITFNFGIQLLVDLLSAKFVDKIGYRVCITAAHVLSAAGLVLLPVLPHILPPFAGILLAVSVYAVGGGLLEVLVSPILESCPAENHETAMSLLHSFYCWGHVGVVLLSTVFFHFFGTENWPVLSLIWAVLPAVNALVFLKTPLAPPVPAHVQKIPLPALLKNRTFWLLSLMMVCAGAGELSVSQWSSAFAEQGLGVGKTVGDLAGPMFFAVLMGLSRTLYGKYGAKIKLDRFMLVCCAGLLASYLLITLSPYPVVSLLGCGLTGLSVGIMWPGTFSKAAATLRGGGTAMFALLALFGDLGAAGGPTLVGIVADRSGSLQTGVLAAIVFPAVMMLCLFGRRKKHA